MFQRAITEVCEQGHAGLCPGLFEKPVQLLNLEGGLGYHLWHAHRTVQKRTGLDSNACPKKHPKTTALRCIPLLSFYYKLNNRPWGYKCCFWTSWPQQTKQIMWNKATGCLPVIISKAFLRKCSCYDNWFSNFPFYLAGISNLLDVK